MKQYHAGRIASSSAYNFLSTVNTTVSQLQSTTTTLVVTPQPTQKPTNASNSVMVKLRMFMSCVIYTRCTS